MKQPQPRRRRARTAPPKDIEQDYAANIDRFDALGQEVKFALDQEIMDAGLKIHESSYRIKSIESIRVKIANRQLPPLISSVSDVVGARVVCLFRSDIESIIEIIERLFEVEERDDKTRSDSEVFGYFSIHLICRLKKEHVGPRYDRLRDIKFEIQVRTLCMHAWAVVSHYLDYKGDWDVPDELKRSLNALSGLFWVADSQFEAVSKERDASRADAIVSARSGSTLEQNVNFDTVSAYLDQTFPDRPSSREAISDLVAEIKEAGFESVAEFAAVIEKMRSAFERYEERHPPDSGRYASVGVARVSLTLGSEAFEQVRKSKFPSSSELFKQYDGIREEFL